MKSNKPLLLLLFLCFSSISASFNFFGFGLTPTEIPTKTSEATMEAASSNSAPIMLPNSLSSSTPATPGYTSILFGTGVTGNTGTTSDSSRPMGGVGFPGGIPQNTGILNPNGMVGSNGLLGGTSSKNVVSTNGGIKSPNSGPWSQRPPITNNGITGSRTPSLPPPSPPTFQSYHHNTQTQTKGQGYHHSTSTLPQSTSSGMSLHNPNFSPNLAKNPSSLSPINPGNTQPYLNHASFNQNNQYYVGHGQASHQFQTSNGIKFNEETHLQDSTRFGQNNEGFGKSGKVTTKKGSFSWTSPEGQVYEVNYVADSMGYRPTGAHIPTNEATDEVKLQPNLEHNPNYSYTDFKPMNPIPPYQ